jgi:hypothetical protein
MQGERVHTEIAAAADELVASGTEVGLQVAVVKEGHLAARIDNIVARTLT